MLNIRKDEIKVMVNKFLLIHVPNKIFLLFWNTQD